MSQHDMVLDNAAGAAFRADANSALGALVTNSSGATEPSVKYAYQFWADSSSGLLKIRNAANNAWITIGTLATGGLGIAVAATQSEQEAAASSTVMTTPANQKFHPSALKAWAQWDTTGSLAAGSYNVSTVTDNGLGAFTVNFIIPFSSSVYAKVAMPSESNPVVIMSFVSPATGGIGIISSNTSAVRADSSGSYTAMFFGDQ